MPDLTARHKVGITMEYGNSLVESVKLHLLTEEQANRLYLRLNQVISEFDMDERFAGKRPI